MKSCKHCGSVMTRRRFGKRLEDRGAFERKVFCDRACMASWMTGRMRVQNVKNSRRQSAKEVGCECEVCGKASSRLVVHHIDEDPENNSGCNLATLCGSCHRRSHSPNFADMGRRRRSCKHCSNPAQSIGMCHTHLTRLGKYGDPLLTKIRVGQKEWKLVRVES